MESLFLRDRTHDVAFDRPIKNVIFFSQYSLFVLVIDQQVVGGTICLDACALPHFRFVLNESDQNTPPTFAVLF